MKTKRFLLIALAVILTVALAVCVFVACNNGNDPSGPSGPSDDKGTDGLQFALNEDKESYAVVGIEDKTTAKITIPSTYDDKPVTVIGEQAFALCEISELTLPSSITKIGYGAFAGSAMLEKVFYGGTVESWCRIELEYPQMSYAQNPMLYANHFYMKQSGEWQELTEIVIPESISEIKNYTFGGFNNVTSVIIPSTVTRIGEYAFAYCEGLQTITIPSTVESLGSNAFYWCFCLTINCETAEKPEAWADDWNNLGSMVYNYKSCPVVWNYLENEVADDGYIYAFVDGVRYVLKDGKATVVHSNYSGEMTIATQVQYKDSVYDITGIGDNAFCECYMIKVTIPKNITSIGVNAFYGCSNLTIYCEVSAEPSTWGSNWNFDMTTYIVCPVVWNCLQNDVADNGYIYTIVEDVKYALKDGEASVAGGSCVGEVTFLSSVEYKGSNYAVTSIGMGAFINYRGITKVIIPDSVTSIDNSAFSGCTLLREVTIPSSVKIMTDSFGSCVKLENVYYDGTLEDWCGIDFRGYSPMSYATHFYIKQNGAWQELTEIVIPESVSEIDSFTFYGFNNVTSVTIPSSVTLIYGAFRGCESLDGIYYEGTLENWCGINFGGNMAKSVKHFYLKQNGGWQELTEIVIPESVSKIGAYTFGCFSNVTSVTIPISVTSIGASAFGGCESLESVYYEGTLESWCAINFESYSSNPMYYANRFYIKSGEEWQEVTDEIVLPEGVTEIGNYAFYGFGNVISVTIPSSVARIGSSAFDGCESLENVYYGGTLERFFEVDFVSSPMNYADHFYMKQDGQWQELTEIVIPEGVSNIESFLFSGFNSVTSVTIPYGVTQISMGAFAGCSGLTNITIPSSVIYIESFVFVGCESLENVYYEGTLEDWLRISLPYDDASHPMTYANHFYTKNDGEWQELTEIVISEGVTEIKDRAFYGFNNVTSITISSTIRWIGSDAFCNCSSLREIIIPSSVNKIGNCAFEGCDSLEKVTFENPDGWSANGDVLTLTDPTQNATLLTETYTKYYWERKD